MRVTIAEKDGPRREPGSEHYVCDRAGRVASGMVVREMPVAGGFVQHEVEVPDDALDVGDARFVPSEDLLDDGGLRCQKTIMVGANARQCGLRHGHLEPHRP